MTADRESLVRQRAHQIWESEGGPHGRAAEHWDQARREIEEALVEAKAEAGAPPLTATEPEAAPKRRARSKAAEPALEASEPARKSRKRTAA